MERATEPAVGRIRLVGQTLVVVLLAVVVVGAGYGPAELPGGTLVGAVLLGGLAGAVGGVILYWATGRIAQNVRRFALIPLSLVAMLIVFVPPSSPALTVADALGMEGTAGAAGGTAVLVALATLTLVGWVCLDRGASESG